MSSTSPTPATGLDNHATKEQLSFAELMPRVASEYSKPLGAQLKDILSLCLRGNKLSVDEYYQMRLFDDATYSADEKKRFVGLAKSRQIWAKLMEHNRHLGLLDDKLAYEQMMRGFGFEMPETLAFVGGQYPQGAPFADISNVEELSHFFSKVDFPVFGKPVNSLQSLGSARFDSYDAKTATLALSNGKSMSVQQLFDEITDSFQGNYLFQKCLTPHSKMQALCGKGLPTVRVVTLDSGNGPELYRAGIKLIGNENVADNFWRAGNMLAAIDIETGSMGKALTQMGIDGEFLERHPQTDEVIEGVVLPHWDAICRQAVEAARLLTGTIIVGFDIAIGESGPVIVEANGDPHLILMQIAHRKGVLDAPMMAALENADTVKQRKFEAIKADLAAEAAQTKRDVKQATSRKAA